MIKTIKIEIISIKLKTEKMNKVTFINTAKIRESLLLDMAYDEETLKNIYKK